MPLVRPLTTKGFVRFARVAEYSLLRVLLPVTPPSLDLQTAVKEVGWT